MIVPRFPRTLGILAAMLVTAVSVAPLRASAQSITTTFGGNNGFAGNMFDVSVNASPITITGMDVNIGSSSLRGAGKGATALISVYGRSGGFAGFEFNQGAWTLLSQNTVLAAGSGLPTFVDVTDFTFQSGSLWGLYVTITNYGDPLLQNAFLIYSNGAGNVSNADLSLSFGVGRADPDFAGSSFEPRTWNGTLYYNVASSTVPEPSAMALVGVGLAGLALARRRKRA